MNHASTSTATETVARRADGTSGDQFVTCVIDQELYAIPVQMVREVLRWKPVTRVPHSAPCVKGVINLRGAIVPLIDVRTLLRLPEATPTDRTCVVVVSLLREGARLQAGLIVDAALEVIHIAEEMARDQLTGRFARYVSGVATVKGELIMQLACDAIVVEALLPTGISDAP